MPREIPTNARAAITRGLAALLLLFVACTAALAQKQPPAKPLDLNTATLEQLEQLPGVGPNTAQAVIRFREKSGPFNRVEDLHSIHGISKARFEKIRPYITVSPSQK